MPFSPATLGALIQGNGFTLWHYRTGDAPADIDNVGYFNPAANMLRVGDFVYGHSDGNGWVCFDYKKGPGEPEWTHGKHEKGANRRAFHSGHVPRSRAGPITE